MKETQPTRSHHPVRLVSLRLRTVTRSAANENQEQYEVSESGLDDEHRVSSHDASRTRRREPPVFRPTRPAAEVEYDKALPCADK